MRMDVALFLGIGNCCFVYRRNSIHIFMTYQDMIFELIERGETSREKMAEHTGLTVKQVERAVNNLATAKRIEFVSQASAGWHKGTQPAIYRVTVEREAAPVRARVNSVWQLGAT